MLEIIRKSENVITSCMTVNNEVKCMVVYNDPKWGQKHQAFDDRYSALQFHTLISRTLKFGEAKEAGLDDNTADRVAMGQMTLAEALGDMDVTDESEFMEGYDDWLSMQGGEDDNTPSLEVIMAGGQAAWEYQNEKNAWLDSRF